MFEKVNPAHPDKIADRIAGAIVDLAYKIETNPKVAVEVLIGHSKCLVIIESSICFFYEDIEKIVLRIAGPKVKTDVVSVRQNANLSANQSRGIKCGDNGIFKGMPITSEQIRLKSIASNLYNIYHTDGKYILTEDKLVICQSCANSEDIKLMYPRAKVNPIGYWTGGTDVDAGATNRKLGSDMGDAVTGGGLHGKDLSKADVSVNIYAHIKAQQLGVPVELSCAIGDEFVDGKPYEEIVKIARAYISGIGGFEKFAEWGLI